MEALKIQQTFTVGGRTFDTEAAAQSYLVIEQHKREALKILFDVRPFDSNPFDSSRNGLQMSNAELVELMADNLQTFAQIVALLEEAEHRALKIERQAGGRSVQTQEVE